MHVMHYILSVHFAFLYQHTRQDQDNPAQTSPDQSRLDQRSQHNNTGEQFDRYGQPFDMVGYNG